jgi:hypothetical protein
MVPRGSAFACVCLPELRYGGPVSRKDLEHASLPRLCSSLGITTQLIFLREIARLLLANRLDCSGSIGTACCAGQPAEYFLLRGSAFGTGPGAWREDFVACGIICRFWVFVAGVDGRECAIGCNLNVLGYGEGRSDMNRRKNARISVPNATRTPDLRCHGKWPESSRS